MTPQQLSGAAQSASRKWASASSELRTECVLALAAGIDSARDVILRENQLDLTEGRSAGLSPALLDRLLLDDSRLDAMIEGIKHVAKLPDILGQKLRTYEHPSGMSIESVRVPIGVVLMIYESRPNVSSDSAALCLKTGNAVILRGGKEARRSNLAIVNAMSGAAASSGLPEGTLSFVEDQRR
ncbi:MAG: aldehyde dehydrogenase family protein, partial [Bdellovibrionales bacterium]|nr:aldehyde dehydrogenase family protein [Bdellovibrionales bacterium]